MESVTRSGMPAERMVMGVITPRARAMVTMRTTLCCSIMAAFNRGMESRIECYLNLGARLERAGLNPTCRRIYQRIRLQAGDIYIDGISGIVSFVVGC